MIRISSNITFCPRCNKPLQEYYDKTDSKEVFKRCPNCTEIYCVSYLDSSTYENRNGGLNV
jgi:uncharacterized protein with PIN domain